MQVNKVMVNLQIMVNKAIPISQDTHNKTNDNPLMEDPHRTCLLQISTLPAQDNQDTVTTLQIKDHAMAVITNQGVSLKDPLVHRGVSQAATEAIIKGGLIQVDTVSERLHSSPDQQRLSRRIFC